MKDEACVATSGLPECALQGEGPTAGFIDGMGYIGASLTGWGAGLLIDKSGYQVTFQVFGSAAILGALLACVLWKVGPTTDHRGRET